MITVSCPWNWVRVTLARKPAPLISVDRTSCSGRTSATAGPGRGRHASGDPQPRGPNGVATRSPSTVAATRLASPRNRAIAGSTGWSYSSWGVPHWPMVPSRITATWSATDSASSWSWVTSTAVISAHPQDTSCTSDRTLERSPASSEENGSSNRTRAGPDGQGPGQGHPLLLPAGELVRVPVAHPGQTDHLQQLVHPPTASSAGPAGQPKPTLAATVRWGNSDPSWGTYPMPALLGGRARRVILDHPAAEGHRAAVGPLESGHHPQQGGLPAARRTENGGERAERARRGRFRAAPAAARRTCGGR